MVFLTTDKMNILLELPRLRVAVLVIIFILAVVTYKLWGKNPKNEFTTWLKTTREKNAKIAQEINESLEKHTSSQEEDPK